MSHVLQELTPQQPGRVDNPADLVPARSYVRALVAGLVLMIGAVLAFTRAFAPLPDFQALTRFEGTVAEVIPVRSETTGFSSLFREQRVIRYDTRFVGRSANYKYAASSPKSPAIANLRAGECTSAMARERPPALDKIRGPSNIRDMTTSRLLAVMIPSRSIRGRGERVLGAERIKRIARQLDLVCRDVEN